MAAVSYKKSNYLNFVYKVSLVTLFLILLQLLPSIAPVHARSWELLQLIFVGIAVSYGLFSKRNNEVEPSGRSKKLDDAQSYLTHKLHQVSSVFYDESESQAVIEETDSKVKTLMINSKYCRGEPVVVVANQYAFDCGITPKPLLLPVRSLKHSPFVDDKKAITNGDELFPQGETFVEKVMMETSDEDSDDNNNNDIINHHNSVSDVDKKADEFIAKFREQIRQQRIESIRISTAHVNMGRRESSRTEDID